MVGCHLSGGGRKALNAPSFATLIYIAVLKIGCQ